MIGKNFAGVNAFMKVATALSISAAARELGVSAPAISKSISRLEDQLGVRLLDRSTHQVTLTHEGQYFFENGSVSVDKIAELFRELRDFSTHAVGSVRVSSTVGFGRKCIAPLLTDFCTQHPDIKLELELTDRIKDYSVGKYDLAIRNGRLFYGSLIARKLAPMRMTICASPAYLERSGLPTSIADLRQMSIIGFRHPATGKPSLWEFEINGEFSRIAMPEKLIFNDPELVTHATLAGAGIAQLANYQIDSYLASGQLVALMSETIAEGRAHYLCYNTTKKMPVRTRLLIDHIMASFQ